MAGSYTTDTDFTLDEIREAVSKAADATSPVEDQVSVALLKMNIMHAPHHSNIVLELITLIAQAEFDTAGQLDPFRISMGKMLWKKPSNKHASNLRPLTLQNAISKIPSKILA